MTAATPFPQVTPANKIAAFVAIMAAIAIPLRMIGVAPQQTALGLALAGALALYYTNAEIRKLIKQALTSNIGMFVGVIILTWAITVPFSLAPLGSLKIGGRTFVFLLGIVFVWAALKNHEDIHELLWKILVTSGVVSASIPVLLLGVVPMVYPLNLNSVVTLALTFKAFAAPTLCMIPIVIWAGRRLSGQWRFWAYAHAPLAIAVLLLTHNRAALAGLLAMIVTGMAMIIFTKYRHTKILFVLSGIAGIIILAWVRNERLPLVAASVEGMYLPEWLIDPHRQRIWQFAYERFLEAPWFGNGIDQLRMLSGATLTVPGLGNTAALIPSHPHNWALELLAETGIVGFLPVLATLIFVAWRLTKRFIRTHDEGALAQLTLMAGFWGSALFNFSIWAVWWQLTFFTLFAIVSAAPQNKNKHQLS
ncbi:MAG: O-antigen ligase family protein [Rhodospirillales bacterium]|nr:O-antigen ligase family protein [Rhodospirillales bacterium]